MSSHATKKTEKMAATRTRTVKKAVDSSPPAERAVERKVTVRMYNVGFGDAFLIMLPTEGRTRKILIDCGVHASGTNPKFKLRELVKRIIEDVSEDGTPRIDVVVATHRHRDHVHGFREADWENVEVGEVWMPWTEHPTDPQAREIREVQGKIAERLDKELKKQIDDPQKFGLGESKVRAAKDLRDFISNSLPNAEAMQMLHEGFAVFTGMKKVHRCFLPYENREDNSFESELLPGVIVHVMGPSRDPAIIRDMDPPKGRSYLRLMESSSDGEDGIKPFRSEWILPADDHNSQSSSLTESEMKKIKNAGLGTEFGVAVKLEDAVNGTSLMIMFQIGKAYLLFPGDAQWGTWEAAKNDPVWRRLLEKTNFYKVGHHGSHNATPKEFVTDILKGNFLGMVSLRPIKRFKFIPKSELMTALKNKPGKIVRSDLRDAADPPDFRWVRDTRVGDIYVEVDIPT